MISNYINAHQNSLALTVCLILTTVCYIFQCHNCRRLMLRSAVLYTFFIVWKTVFSRKTRDTVMVTVFLQSYRALMDGTPGMFSQIYLNVMLFVPFGLFSYAALKGKMKGIWTIVFGMTLSISIEFMQLFFHRGTFELDDILNNTIGASIGTLIAYGIECFCTKQERKNDKNRGTI